ncbi:MAG: HPP family protein [Actinobacteria bacterium]|nr:HPP family protein [Actinomycetota bacterium]
MSDVLKGLLRRFRLPALTERYGTRLALGFFAFTNGLVSIGIMSAAAAITGQPLIFPSLGPTAFLLFYTPRAPAASPRNAIYGHLIGASAGYLSLVIFGLTDHGAAFAEGVTWPRVGAAALSLALTSGFMAWLLAPHPPAGATTLIVSLGIMTKPSQLAFLMLAVVLLVLQGLVINRSAGIAYPLWRSNE